MVTALHDFALAGGQIRSLFQAETAAAVTGGSEAVTADVLASEGQAELCAEKRRHDLAAVSERLHPRDPYEAFDPEGLKYSAGEHQVPPRVCVHRGPDIQYKQLYVLVQTVLNAVLQRGTGPWYCPVVLSAAPGY